MNENEISYKIIGAALEIHKNIGPGLLESAYENALAFELNEMGIDVKKQMSLKRTKFFAPFAKISALFA